MQLWTKKGNAIITKSLSGKKHSRTTLIAGLNINANPNTEVKKNIIIAPMYFEGTTNTDIFCNWLENFLLPELKEGQTIVMDNASIHKSGRVKELIEKHNCKLLYSTSQTC